MPPGYPDYDKEVFHYYAEEGVTTQCIYFFFYEGDPFLSYKFECKEELPYICQWMAPRFTVPDPAPRARIEGSYYDGIGWER